MAHARHIPLDQMREQGALMTVEQARTRLASTEPLSAVSFPMHGSSRQVARFKLEPGWNAGFKSLAGTDAIDAAVKIGASEFRLTKDALLAATSEIGLPRNYVSKTPGRLIEPQLNYWFSNQDSREMKILAANDLALAFTKASVNPFSNQRFLDDALQIIETRYGAGEVFIDEKMHHDLRHTAMRIVIPAETRRISSYRDTDDKQDLWSAGIQLRNSIVGESPTSLNGYLFAYWCTNGQIDTHAASGNWNRRTGGQGDEVYEWAREAVDTILGGLEHSFDAVDELAHTPVEGELGVALRDVFDQFRVPVESREGIIQQLTEEAERSGGGQVTWYAVQQAITQQANGEVRESVRNTLMEIGGDIPLAVTHRCNNCRRIQPA